MKFQKKAVAAVVASLVLLPLATGASAGALTQAFNYNAAMIDQGLAPSSTKVSVAISLNIVNRAALDSFIASTTDPGSRNYRKFITPAQFAARYGQPAAVIERVTSYLQGQGMTVTKVYGNNLLIMARADNATLSRVFGTAIHSFTLGTQSFQRPVSSVMIPAEISDVVGSVRGLSTQPPFRPHLRVVDPNAVPLAPATRRGVVPATTPGHYTVTDFASQYNVSPLYARGTSGAGKTIGIMTFASFNQADAYAYWTATGVSVLANRITEVVVDDGEGGVVGTDGDDETTLDVEQSGGIAPQASIRVYEAPNTDAGAIALYTQTVMENLCDTISTSWGESELYYDPADLVPYEAVFLQAAAQGTPVSASSGDEGAFDLNYSQAFPYPSYSTVLSVDYPASSPSVLSAGGTTLPVTLTLSHGTIVVPYERPWAWDYIRDYLVSYSASGQSSYYRSDFPAGGGGGVSVQFPLPSYQTGLAGLMTSAPGQALLCFASPSVDPCTPGADLLDVPAGYAGRNSPDVSLNADPETGYGVYYKSAWHYGYGGTSFVAPQLAGIFTLISQELGGRVGQPHPQLYAAFKAKGYATGSPFRAIGFGNNLFYISGATYNPASGLGALDVSNLANTLEGH